MDDLAHQMQLLLKAKPPTNLREGWGLLKQGVDLLHARPKRVKDGPCKEVVTRFDGDAANGLSLADLPILKCWPQDGGRFITLPNVYTRDPDTGERNLGMYRMQVYDGRTTGMHWQVHKVGARHGKRYYERGERMPVAVCLGGDPAYTFAATAPLPDGSGRNLICRVRTQEIGRTGALRDGGPPKSPPTWISCSKATSSPVRLGPRGRSAITPGSIHAVDDYPVFHLTAITHRKDAVYPATIVGVPPMEDYYIGDASVRVFLPVMKMNFPEIVDLTLPPEGVFHNLVFVSIRKQYPFQAYKIMHGLWGMGQMMFSKYIVVVDEDCDVHNTSEVLFRLCANTDPQRDSTFIKSPCDSLDHAPTVPNIGSHMGFDATRKLPGEGYTRNWPELVRMDADTKTRVDTLLRAAATATG